MKKDILYWLRWIAVLPGAIAGMLLGRLMIKLILYQSLRHWVTPVPNAPSQIIGPFFISIAFIYTGTYIAPEFKKIVLIVLFSLLIFLAGGNLFLIISGGTLLGVSDFYFAYKGIPATLFVIGTFVGLYISYKKLVLNENLF